MESSWIRILGNGILVMWMIKTIELRDGMLIMRGQGLDLSNLAFDSLLSQDSVIIVLYIIFSCRFIEQASTSIAEPIAFEITKQVMCKKKSLKKNWQLFDFNYEIKKNRDAVSKVKLECSVCSFIGVFVSGMTDQIYNTYSVFFSV